MLYFKLYRFTLLKQSHSFTFIFMFWVNRYSIISQVIIDLPQSAQTLHFLLLTNCLCLHLKSCFVLLNSSSRSRSAHCRLVSIFIIFLALFCLTPELLCSLLTCLWLNLKCCFVLLNNLCCSACTCLDCVNLFCFVLVNTSSHSAHSWLVSVHPSQSFSLRFAQHFDSLVDPYFLLTGFL